MICSVTPRLLSSIIRDIAGGFPLWGMLRANEYLQRDHPLRSALAARTDFCRLSGLGQEILDLILRDGRTLREIPPELRDTVMNMERPTKQKGHPRTGICRKTLLRHLNFRQLPGGRRRTSVRRSKPHVRGHITA